MIRHPFPTAVHTYFRALNKYSQKRNFLAGLVQEPEFTYKAHWTKDLIEKRLRLTKDDSMAFDRLQVVKSSLKLREKASELESFRSANAKVFHVPTRELAEAIICRISQNVSENERQIWQESLELLGVETLDRHSVEPTDAIFQMYRGYLKRYTTIPALSTGIIDALHEQLSVTGLTSKGWVLRLVKGSEHAQTHHGPKTITIGESYKPRSLSAVQRIAIHEVVGHAVRGPQQKIDESEGFAIVLEQLTKSSFAFRRTYRYLAVALGWGVFGTRMTFREVYEVLWRLMIVHSKYSIEAAKEHAFDECYRAFRGGRPDIAGAVLLKDTVYFDANIRMWEALDTRELSYNEFIDIIEGRRTILS